jgi:peptidoglycan/xylan/chitin deacetylase (PgdA/CDA1 family)
MYHYISAPPEDADVYRTDLSVAPEAFRQQMAYLVENGYTTIDLYDLTLAIVNQKELPPKPVIITLDDGYRDNYENAFPILREFGLKATFFIITDLADKGLPAYMDWAMIQEMAAAGMRIEPHTKTHADLRGQEREYVIWQILGSRETVAAHIGYMPRYFAYPGGRYDDLALQIVRELDFWGAVTTAGGKDHGFNDRYEWPRLRVRYTTSLPEFIDLIEP